MHSTALAFRVENKVMRFKFKYILFSLSHSLSRSKELRFLLCAVCSRVVKILFLTKKFSFFFSSSRFLAFSKIKLFSLLFHHHRLFNSPNHHWWWRFSIFFWLSADSIFYFQLTRCDFRTSFWIFSLFLLIQLSHNFITSEKFLHHTLEILRGWNLFACSLQKL